MRIVKEPEILKFSEMKQTMMIALMLFLFSAGTMAQNNSKFGDDPRTVISTRPISLLLKQSNIQLEHAFASNISGGLAFTHFSGLNKGFKLDPFVRVYTGKGNNAPQGFYLQGKLSAGTHQGEIEKITTPINEVGEAIGEDIIESTTENLTAFGGGFGVGSQWFVGSKKNISLDLFGGLKRYKIVNNGNLVDNALFSLTRGWPVEMRFSVGFAF